jgi:hypothetical protein
VTAGHVPGPRIEISSSYRRWPEAHGLHGLAGVATQCTTATSISRAGRALTVAIVAPRHRRRVTVCRPALRPAPVIDELRRRSATVRRPALRPCAGHRRAPTPRRPRRVPSRPTARAQRSTILQITDYARSSSSGVRRSTGRPRTMSRCCCASTQACPRGHVANRPRAAFMVASRLIARTRHTPTGRWRNAPAAFDAPVCGVEALRDQPRRQSKRHLADRGVACAGSAI